MDDKPSVFKRLLHSTLALDFKNQRVDVEAVPRDQSLDFLPSSEKAVCSLQTPMLSAPPLVF